MSLASLVSCFPGLEVAWSFLFHFFPACILRKPSGPFLPWVGLRMEKFIPHPSQPTLMIIFLKEPGGEIPKLLVVEFQAEDEQINNGLPN